MNVAIIGASGFLGKNLTKYLLENTDHEITAISLDPESISIEDKYKNRVKNIKANVLDEEEIKEALSGIDVAYYFVHMMTNYKNNFHDKETLAAETTGQALKSNGVRRVIYMSGLGNDNEDLSRHLASRHNTGDILKKYLHEVIEFRASMIIGEGSASFEIVRNIIDKAPIITLPRWSKTKTQPIGINDALLYLKEACEIKINGPEIVEIGGLEKMSYLEFVKKYRDYHHKKNIIIRIPFLSEEVAGKSLPILMNKNYSMVGQNMLSSFKNKMIVTNNRAKELFPDISPKNIEESFI
jgi:uncharacterized protein YbjT (DUF2867 family)